MKIIVVEDNLDLQQEIVYLLNKSGHEAVGVGSAPELDRRMAAGKPDVVLLDIGLPGEDGLSIARRLRDNPNMGIIMLTARGSEEDHIQGLEGGADNYLVKPVNRRLLLASLDRVHQRLTRSASGSEAPSAWRLARREQELLPPGGAPISLTYAEVILIETMVRHEGKPASRRLLIEALGYDYLTYDERRIEVKLSRLRKKIRDLTGGEEPVRAEWGVGYMFVPPCAIC